MKTNYVSIYLHTGGQPCDTDRRVIAIVNLAATCSRSWWS